MLQGRLGNLCANVIATGPQGHAGPAYKGVKTFQAHVQGSGAVEATVQIQVSNADPALVASSWVVAATFTLSGTTVATDATTLEGPFGYWRANVTALTGTDATLNVWVNQ